uniref:transmembrane protein 216 isoform X3 n=1 Tax=Scatophagus argus TaxID=75038 RepID=UPI001ED80B90|nr:transmembrane protein 216 isoform X3 [Scatophagus argus]
MKGLFLSSSQAVSMAIRHGAREPTNCILLMRVMPRCSCSVSVPVSVSGILLPYPSDNLVLDVVLLLLFLALETVRIFYGGKGNLCERSLASCVSLFMLIPCAALAVYYLLLQTFVLRFEVLLNTILICFYILEFLLGLLSISAFSRS